MDSCASFRYSHYVHTSSFGISELNYYITSRYSFSLLQLHFSLYYLYYLYLSYLFSKMKVTTFKFYDHCLNEDLSVLNDDETIEASNQLFSTTLCLVLQIKASNNLIIDTKFADAKTTLKSTLGTSAFFLPWDMKQQKVLKLSLQRKIQIP